MGKFYYAISCPRGIRTACPSDTLFRFDSKRKRDQFVDKSPLCRVAVTRSQANKYFPMAFQSTEYFEPEYWAIDLENFDHCDAWMGSPTGGVYQDVR